MQNKVHDAKHGNELLFHDAQEHISRTRLTETTLQRLPNRSVAHRHETVRCPATMTATLLRHSPRVLAHPLRPPRVFDDRSSLVTTGSLCKRLPSGGYASPIYGHNRDNNNRRITMVMLWTTRRRSDALSEVTPIRGARSSIYPELASIHLSGHCDTVAFL